MAINKKLDENSVTSMISGYLSNQKENMIKRNRMGAKKKVQQFWKNINESAQLTEAVDAKIGNRDVSVVGAVPSAKGPSMFRVVFKDSGESTLVPKEQIQFTRIEPKKGTEPKQSIGIGTSAPGGGLSDESDPQWTNAPEKEQKRLATTPEEKAEVLPPSGEENEMPQTATVPDGSASNKTGKRRLELTPKMLRQKLEKRILYFINSDSEFRKKYYSAQAKSKSQDPEERKLGNKQLEAIRVQIATKIKDEYNAKVKKMSLKRDTSSVTGASAENYKDFISNLSKKFLDGIAPDLSAGKLPNEDLLRMGKELFGIELRTPQVAKSLAKALAGQNQASPEVVNSFVQKVASKNQDLIDFAKVNLDAFPGNFIDKIEAVANKENIPSEYEYEQAGQAGGLGTAIKRYIPPPSIENDERIKPEQLEKLRGAVYSRSKIGTTPIFKAANSLKIEDIAKLANYFKKHRSEVERSQNERINKSLEFSSGKLPEPGKSSDKMSEIGSDTDETIFDQREKKDISQELSKQKKDFKKDQESRFEKAQDSEDDPIEAAPSFKVPEKALPTNKEIWSRLVNVNLEDSPFVNRLVSTAARSFGSHEDDVREVLRALLKTNSSGEVVGLKDPNKELIDLPMDEKGNFINKEDPDIAQKLFYVLNQGRLQSFFNSTRTEKTMDLNPAFDEFKKAQAEKLSNVSALEKHRSSLAKKQEREKQERERELEREKIQKISPEEIEASEQERDSKRAVLGQKIRNYISSLKNPDGSLKDSFVQKFEIDPENYRHALTMIQNARDSGLLQDEEVRDEVSKFISLINSLHSKVPSDAYTPPDTVRSSPSTRGINKPSGRLVLPQAPKEDYEKKARDKDFLGVSSTDSASDKDAADPEKALKKYKDEEEAGVPKTQRSVVVKRYGNPQITGSKFSKETSEEVKNRRLKPLIAAAKKHVAKQGVPLTKASVSRSLKRLIEKNPKYKDLANDLNYKETAKDSIKVKQESKEMKEYYKLSLFEFLVLPGKKKLGHAEVKEKAWNDTKPVVKKKWEPKFEKQKKPSAKK